MVSSHSPYHVSVSSEAERSDTTLEKTPEVDEINVQYILILQFRISTVALVLLTRNPDVLGIWLVFSLFRLINLETFQ